MNESYAKQFTHTAHIFKSEGVRRGRKIGYWVHEGYGRDNPDGSRFIYLHSTPIGGFDGRILLTPIGKPGPQPNESMLHNESADESGGGDEAGEIAEVDGEVQGVGEVLEGSLFGYSKLSLNLIEMFGFLAVEITFAVVFLAVEIDRNVWVFSRSKYIVF